MDLKRLFDYCLSKSGAYVEFSFGEIPALIKVNGRIFAELYNRETKPQVTLKCDPVLARLLREKYSGVVIPGYHVPVRNRLYWNTVLLDNDEVPEKEILEMIDHSYSEVLKKLKGRNKTGRK